MQKRSMAFAAAVLIWAASALAHTHLTKSVPADGADLTKAPTEVTLTFAEPVTLTAARIESSDGTRSTLTPDSEAKAEQHLKLPALGPGRYRVSWRGASADGHIMNGAISFTIGAASKP